MHIDKDTYHHAMREARFKRQDTLQVLDLLRAQRHVERLDVRLQLLNLAASDDGEDIRCLLHHVRDRDSLDALRPDLLCNLFEGLAELPLALSALPVGPAERAPILACLSASFFLLVRPDTSSCEDVPWREGQSYDMISDPSRRVSNGGTLPSSRAMGMMSRSKSRWRMLHAPW